MTSSGHLRGSGSALRQFVAECLAALDEDEPERQPRQRDKGLRRTAPKGHRAESATQDQVLAYGYETWLVAAKSCALFDLTRRRSTQCN